MRAYMRDKFLRDAKFPISDTSYDVQICLLSFATCLTYLFVPPCTDPSTRPNIQESDVQVTCSLSFWYYYYTFLIFAFWNAVSYLSIYHRVYSVRATFVFMPREGTQFSYRPSYDSFYTDRATTVFVRMELRPFACRANRRSSDRLHAVQATSFHTERAPIVFKPRELKHFSYWASYSRFQSERPTTVTIPSELRSFA